MLISFRTEVSWPRDRPGRTHNEFTDCIVLEWHRKLFAASFEHENAAGARLVSHHLRHSEAALEVPRNYD
jgi:hypothetical protein